MTDEVYNEVQRKMLKLEGLNADLNNVHDAICDLRDADEDAPWVLRYLLNETTCMGMLHNKAEAILRFMQEEANALAAL
jgi:hypothetical protein